MRSATRGALFLLILHAISSFPSAAAAQGDANWWGGFGYPGTGRPLLDLAVFDSAVYVCDGDGLLRWNGSDWIDMAAGEINAIEVHAGRLVVGGRFVLIGGVGAKSIAAFDGVSWQSLGSGLEHAVVTERARVTHMAVHGSDLIVAGDFARADNDPAQNIARWDGFGWSGLGSGIVGEILALGSFGGELYVGGSLSLAGGMAVNNIASWDGISWSGLGVGVNGVVRALAEFQGELMIGGDFFNAGGQLAINLAAWDGASWSVLGSIDRAVETMLVDGGELLLAGRGIGFAGTTLTGGVVRFDGSNWNDLGPQVDGNIKILLRDGAQLYIGGEFAFVEGQMVPNLIRFDGVDWDSFDGGKGVERFECSLGKLDSPQCASVVSLLPHDYGLVVGGLFDHVGALAVNNVARWDGTRWRPMGEGLSGATPTSFPTVIDLIHFQGELIAGGAFTLSGTNQASGLARWTGSSWEEVGGGVRRALPEDVGSVDAMVEFGGELIVGGIFTEAGGVAANSIAAWNGTSFHALGDGLSFGGFEETVSAVAVYDGKLIAGGSFTESGAIPLDYIAQWDGVSWSPLGAGTDAPVLDLLVYNGELIAAGYFEFAGGVATNYVARWNGSSWAPLGTGLELVGFTVPYVAGLAEYGGRLYVTGNFNEANGSTANSVAQWDGAAWSSLGSGLAGVGNTLGTYFGGLLVGGKFLQAGDKESFNLALWDDPMATAAPLASRGQALLRTVHPNPFNPRTTISFEIPTAGAVVLSIHDVRGRQVSTLLDEELGAGRHHRVWNGRDDAGIEVGSGVYFAQLRFGQESETKKLVLLR